MIDRLRQSVLIILALSLCDVVSQAQTLKPGEWRAYTSMRNVKDLALTVDSAHVWAATSGGAFLANLADPSTPLVALRTANGLSQNDLTAVAVDQSDNVFLGGSDGSIDIYSPVTKSFQHLTDIHTDPRLTSKSINNIAIFGKRVYLSSSFGLSIYSNTQPGYFISTVTSFASLPDQDNIAQALEFNNVIYAVAKEGLVFANKSSELGDKSVWTFLSTRAIATSVAVFHNTIYVGTSAGLFKLSADRHSLDSVTSFGTGAIAKENVAFDSLRILTVDSRFLSSADGSQFSTQDLTHATGGPVLEALTGAQQTIAIATSNAGVQIVGGSNPVANIYPDGPVSNDALDLSFSASTGKLYVANGNAGVSLFDPVQDSWSVGQSGNGPTPNETFRKILYDSIRSVTWVSAHGSGVFSVQNFGSPTAQWVKHNPTPTGEYLVAGQGIIDRDNNFVIALWASTGQGLSITSDGNTFKNLPLTGTSWLPWGCVTQDQSGNYWVGTERQQVPASYGVFWVRATDQVHGSIAGGSGQPLLNAAVNAILTDQDNGIWCGTEQGVNIIANPDAIMSDPNPRFQIRSVKLVDQQIVHAMVTDGVGNKWIGTENGIFVVSPDGSDSIARFSVDNSPLIDNNIRALAIDAVHGEVYVATPSGISRFSTVFKQGNPDYSSLRVYPNPIVQTGESSPTVYIDGLVSGSTIKIISLNGKMVATLDASALGSTIKWDGRDDRGHAIASGIYLVSATSPQTGDNGAAKIVIVRNP